MSFEGQMLRELPTDDFSSSLRWKREYLFNGQILLLFTSVCIYSQNSAWLIIDDKIMNKSGAGGGLDPYCRTIHACKQSCIHTH